MGLFSFRKKKDNIESIVKEENRPYDIEYNVTNSGAIQIDFIDNEISYFRKGYDTTRLIISRVINLADEKVCNCRVSWYDQDEHIDCTEVDKVTGKCDRISAKQYRGVLLQLDLNLLQNNPNYCIVVMRELLEKQRITELLDRGLIENPKVPCGKYIGGVEQTQSGYEPSFSEKLGQASHYSNLMVNRRRENREKEEQKRQEAIARKKEEIARIQDEISQMGDVDEVR